MDCRPATPPLLGRDFAPVVADRLTVQTAGNPLALLECGRALTPVQRAGAATLPAALPVPARLRDLYDQELARLSTGGWAAVLLAAASHDQALTPIADALPHAGWILAVPGRGRRGAGAGGRGPHLPTPAAAVGGLAPPGRPSGARRMRLAAALPAGSARTWHRAERHPRDRELALAWPPPPSPRARRGYAARRWRTNARLC